MLDAHSKHRGLCTLLGTKVNERESPYPVFAFFPALLSHTLFSTLQVPREQANKFGCLIARPETNEVLHYVEKPESFISDLISCGVYLFDSAVFSEIKAALDNKKNAHEENDYLWTAPDDRLRLEQDLLRPLSEGRKLYMFETKNFWRQIKTAG
jgi:mannose-1-phosphate guanylyltransferase